MPNDTPQNTVYSIDDLAGQIKARRPDLASQDNTELVRKLIGAKPEFQQYLSQDDLPKIVGSMGPTSPSLWDRLKSVFTEGNPNYSTRTVYNPKYGQTQLITPEAAMSPLEQKNHPIITAVNEVSGSLTSPENTAIMASTLGLGGIPGAIGKVARAGVGTYFAGTMGQGAYQANQAANQTTDSSEATRLRTHAVLGLAGAGLVGAHTAIDLRPIPGVPLPESPSAQPLPGIPERVTPASPAPAVETPQQAASTPNPLHSFQGSDGPIRPYPPMEARATKGGTIGMDPINPEYAPASPVSPEEHIAAAGLVNRGQLMKTEGPFGVEHPDFRNVTASIKPEDLTSPEAAKQAVARKLNEVADNPPGPVAGQPALDPVEMRAAAQKLLDQEPEQAPQAPPVDISQARGHRALKSALNWLGKDFGRSHLTDLDNATSDALEGSLGFIGRMPEEQFRVLQSQLVDARSGALEHIAKQAKNGVEGHDAISAGMEKFNTEARTLFESASKAYPETLKSSGIDPNNAPQSSSTPAAISPASAPEPLTKFDLEAFHNTFDSVARAEKNIAGPNQAPWQKKRWTVAINKLREGVRDSMNGFLGRLAPEAHDDVLTSLEAESARLRKQAEVGRSVRLTDPLATELRQQTQGAEGRRASGGTEQFSKLKGTPIQIVGAQTRGVLDAIHGALGDEMQVVVDPVVREQRARLIEDGKDPDTVSIPEGYRNLTAEEWKKTRANLIAEQNALKTQLRERIEEHVRERALSDPSIPAGIQAGLVNPDKIRAESFKDVIEERNEAGESYKDRIAELDRIIGRNPTKRIYARKGAPITDEQSVVHPAGAIGEKTLAFANAFFNRKNLNKIPDDAAFEARAKDLERRATLLETLASRVRERKAKLDQRGSVGDSSTAEIHSDARRAAVETLLARGVPTELAAEIGNRLKSAALKDLDLSTLGFRENLTSLDEGLKPTSVLNSDLSEIQQLEPDVRKTQAANLYNPISAAVRAYQKRLGELGVVGQGRGASGLELMGSSATGMTIGAAIGGHVAGAPGAIVGGSAGFAAGFVLPALYRHPVVADVLDSLKNEIHDTSLKFAGGTYNVVKGLTNFLAPKVGVDSRHLDQIMQMKGDVAQTINAAANVLDVYRKNLERLPQPAQIDFIDRYKTGQPQATPELQALDGMIHQLDQENYDKITLFKPGTPFLENHFRMLYKTIPGMTDEGFQNWLGKRPLAGGRGFLQQHVYDTLSDAIANGGVPITTNPVDMFLLSHGDVQRFIHANMLWETWKAEGTATFVKQGDRPAPGYVPLDDRIAKVYFPAKSGEGLVSPGQYYVQEGAGRLMNNYLSPDYIRQNVLGKKIVDAKNIWNGWELLGGFHAVTINGAALVQNLNLATQRMYNIGIRGGDVGALMGGIKDLIKAPAELALGNAPAYLEGKRLQEFVAALDRSNRGDHSALQQFTASDAGQKFLQKYPGAEALLGDAFTGGLNLKMSDDLRSNIAKSMLQDFADKKYIAGSGKLAPAALYAMNRPLFDYYIPRVKLGMFIRDMSQQLKDRAPELLNGSLTRAELARQVVNRTENVFGEMNFDNLFWNRTFKTAMQLFYRSVTWRLGTTLAEGQGIVGQGKELIKAAKAGTTPRLDPSFGFVAGSILTLGVASAVMQKLMSGKNPQSLTDLTHPQTGQKNEQGRPIRLNIPGYGTEFQKLSTHPLDYMVSGRAGWVDRLMESWQNKDFYNKQVANPNDPKWQQLTARVLHAIAPSMIMNSNIDRMRAQGATAGAVGLEIAGFSTASKSLDMTPAELKAQEIMIRSLPQGGKDPQQVARSQALNNVLRTYQNKGDLGAAIQQGMKAGTLFSQDFDVSKKGSIPNRIQTPYIQSLLSGNQVKLNDILSVFDVATKDERTLLKPLLRSRLSELEKTDAATRMQTIARVQAAMRAQ